MVFQTLYFACLVGRKSFESVWQKQSVTTPGGFRPNVFCRTPLSIPNSGALLKNPANYLSLSLGEFKEPFFLGELSPENNVPLSVAIWLILPVVICLSQRLSHACLSISDT
jgi:hypothetical protein